MGSHPPPPVDDIHKELLLNSAQEGALDHKLVYSVQDHSVLWEARQIRRKTLDSDEREADGVMDFSVSVGKLESMCNESRKHLQQSIGSLEGSITTRGVSGICFL